MQQRLVKPGYTLENLKEESTSFFQSGAVSEKCSSFCKPCFLNKATGEIFLSQYPNGIACPFHNLNGLPEEVVLRRGNDGSVIEVLPTIISGFVKDNKFYSRDEIKVLLGKL